MRVFRVGVGELVSFLYASGDLSSETFQNVSLLEGTKAHQYLQSKYQSSDTSELAIHVTYQVSEDISIRLSGRIDGLLVRNGVNILEEIKSTRKNIFDPTFDIHNEHLAQLKMYAYMYMKQENITDIQGRVTYIQLSDYQVRSFEDVFDVDVLEDFFNDSIKRYLAWLEKLYAHGERKRETLKNLYFPFDTYRRGQREMMTAVYQTMMDDDVLFAIAPTGIGKTMAALFSTLKALHEDNQKIFYLTAKTQGKKVALDTMDMLHESGLETKTLEITSKDSICFLDKRECDPEKCPFAKGFFDRLQEATQDIFDHETLMTRPVVERYARKHMVCPFEFSLYVSYFVDVVICDYNYVFDPRAHLIRYFDEDTYKPLLLIDEAHNMISRSRDMYSSTLIRSDIIKLRRLANQMKPTIRSAVKKVLDHFDGYEEALSLTSWISKDHPGDAFIESLKHLMKKIENALKGNPKYPKKTDVMEGYLSILGFIRIYEYYNDAYVTYIEKLDDGDLTISLQCLDASAFIHDTIKHKAYGTVFFSATLYPIEYYQMLLTESQGETLKIKSPFDPERLKIMMFNQVSTRYQDRASSILKVADIISSVVHSKKGNYIAFFPSYHYLNQVLAELGHIDADILVQEKDMSQDHRDMTLQKFKISQKRSQIACFVMGGMFAEGIDYVGDMLHGVIIVGVGLPMLSEQNNQLKAYYQQKFNQGFNYAYTYPGMNKVIQAVGRVIRRKEDYGVAILIDDRFTTPTYKKLYPLEWKKPTLLKDVDHMKQELHDFWKLYQDKK